jgi:hypothetical protein
VEDADRHPSAGAERLTAITAVLPGVVVAIGVVVFVYFRHIDWI